MNKDCKTILNPLKRDGTRQLDRQLPALDPNSIKLDGRDLADHILYMKNYAALLSYRDLNVEQNEVVEAGDWVAFVENDISTIIAIVAKADFSRVKSVFNDAMVRLNKALQSENIESLKFSLLLIVAYADHIFDWRDEEIEIPFFKDLENAFSSSIGAILDQLLAWLSILEKRGGDFLITPDQYRAHLVKYNDAGIELRFDALLSEEQESDMGLFEILYRKWNNIQLINPVSGFEIPNIIDVIPTDFSFNNDTKKRDLEIRLNTMFLDLDQFAMRMQQNAMQGLMDSLEKYAGHQPHMTLFLACLKVFEIAKGQLNSLSKRHLDFYYKNVLLLENKPPTEDKVNLVIELARNISNFKIDAGSTFSAGKDEKGNSLVYKSKEELVVNQTKISEKGGLRSLFIDGDENESLQSIHASDQADTILSLDDPNNKENTAWETFGNVHAPKARIGFAVASPMLLLEAGVRRVSLSFHCEEDSLAQVIGRYTRSRVNTELQNNLIVYLSGAEEWLEVEDKEVIISQDNSILINLNLPADFPAVVPFDNQVFEDGFATHHPVAKVLLRPEGLSTLDDIDLQLAGGITSFEAGKLYQPNQFVRACDTGWVYEVNGQTIGPETGIDQELPIWKKLNLKDTPDYGSLIHQLIKADSGPVRMRDRYYVPNAEFIVPSPANFNQLLWTNISQREYQNGQSYREGEFVGSDLKLYRAAKDNPRQGPSKKSLEWAEIVDYDLRDAHTYKKGSAVNFEEIIYVAQVTPGEILPGKQIAIWEKIQGYDKENAKSYETGSIVEIGGSGDRKLYKLNALGFDEQNVPDSFDKDLEIWNRVPVHDTETEYEKGNIVNFSESLYLAVGDKIAAGENPGASDNWELILKKNIPIYDLEKEKYEPGSLVNYQKSGFSIGFYIAAFKNTGIEPEGKLLWEEERAYEYDPLINYFPGNIVRVHIAEEREKIFYKAKVTSEGIYPTEKEQNVWKPVATIEAYNNSPTNFYEEQKEGKMPRFIEYDGQLYQPEARFRNILPDSNTLFWDDLGTIQEINEFDNRKHYHKGDTIFWQSAEGEPEYYQAQASVKDIDPSKRLNVWERIETRIEDYDPEKPYNIGSYIAFEGPDNVFRNYFEVKGESPEDAPDKWAKIGLVREFVSTIPPYPPNSHVQYEGKVYRAKFQINQLAPEENPAVSDKWTLVETSFPYKYLKPLKVKRLDIEVKVEGLKNLILESDQGIISAGKPFMPFGPQPKAGSRFYIGSFEAFTKPVTEFKLNFSWADLPLHADPSNPDEEPKLDFAKHYENYIEAEPNPNYKEPEEGDPVVPDNDTQNQADTSTMERTLAEDSRRFIRKQPPEEINNDKFGAKLNLLKGGKWLPLGDGIEQLFRLNDTDDENPELPAGTYRTISKELESYRIKLKQLNDLPPFLFFRNDLPQGFINIELTQDFYHQFYNRLLAQVSIVIQNPDLKIGLPNEPYTPVIKEIELDYSAKASINFSTKTKDNFGTRKEQLFHVTPFGQQEFYPISNADSTDLIYVDRHLVPSFTIQLPQEQRDVETRPIDAHGTLFIGLTDLEPPQNLSLLLQVLEASGNPNIELSESLTAWSYLRKNRWVNFNQDEIIKDGTNHLRRSGIVKLSIPEAISKEHTLMPAGLYWIKVSMGKYPDAAADMIDILPQAIEAYFVNQDNDLSHLSTSLPAASISGLSRRKSEVKGIKQPFPSFGGKPQESDEAYFTRVGERLRHKNRGVAIYDIERLILNEFPQIYEVKCLNHSHPAFVNKDTKLPLVNSPNAVSDFSRGLPLEYAPGNIHIVVIPDVRNRNNINALQPHVDSNTLIEIEKFIKPHVSDFVSVHVKNPCYDELKVKCEVALKDQFDAGYYKNKLNQDLIELLSPWLYDVGINLAFGGSLNRNVLIKYIEEFDYIEYVFNLTLIQKTENADGTIVEEEVEEAKAQSSASVLVAAALHDITVK